MRVAHMRYDADVHRFFVSVFFAVCLLPSSALALQESVYSTESFNQTFVYPDIPTFSPPPDGGTGWGIFTAVTGDPANGTLALPEELKSADGKTVLMRGYMFPLDDTDAQASFLFGPYPASCPYHYHVPQNLVIEAHPKIPAVFTYDSFLLRGTLRLQAGIKGKPYYRIDDAEISLDAAESGRKTFHPLFHGSLPSVQKGLETTPAAPQAGDDKAQ